MHAPSAIGEITDRIYPGDLLTPDEVANILRTKTTTLANWRALRIGPSFLKVGGRLVRYRRADLDAFIAAGKAGEGAAQ